MEIIDKATKEWTIEARRRLHRHPDPTGEEAGTQALLFQLLEELGIPARPIAGTGIIADIEGGLPGRTVALRADIDALRIDEVPTDRNSKYISESPGVMHACGHDGHMAMVLGVAKVLAAKGDDLPGRLRLIFQPHEEKHPGGAKAVIDEGGLEGVDAIFGYHIMGYLPSGLIAFRPGPQMAHIRTFEITFTGKSGHHMDPKQCIDPIVMASRFVDTIERDVANELDPTHPFVFGFGSIHGGAQFNQTPDQVVLEGTYRTFDPDDADTISRVMERSLDSLVKAFTSDPDEDVPSIEFARVEGYPVVENDPDLATRAAGLLRDEGFEIDPVTPLNFGAEDFAYYLKEVPGLFMFLGTNNPEKGITAVNHSSRFDLDEDILELGVRAMATLALDSLAQEDSV
jgi:amidohydrolase